MTIHKEAEFWEFMKSNGPNADRSKTNYISWLRFVSENFSPINECLNETKIDEIFIKIKDSKDERDVYKSNKACSDIKSALIKYSNFIQSFLKQHNDA